MDDKITDRRFAYAAAALTRCGGDVRNPEFLRALDLVTCLALMHADGETLLSCSALVQATAHVPRSLRRELLGWLAHGPATGATAQRLSGALVACLTGDPLPPPHPLPQKAAVTPPGSSARLLYGHPPGHAGRTAAARARDATDNRRAVTQRGKLRG